MKPIKGRTYRLKNGEQILVGVYSGMTGSDMTGEIIYKFHTFDCDYDYFWFSLGEIIEEIDPKQRQRIHGKNRRPQNGDFTDYEVRCMVANYCRDITVGMTGWGVPFTVWVELKGLAKFEKGSLYKLDKPTCECEMCDGRRAAHEELGECVGSIEEGDWVRVIDPKSIHFNKEYIVGNTEMNAVFDLLYENRWITTCKREEIEKISTVIEVGDRVKVINPDSTFSFGREGFISKIVDEEIMVDFAGGWRGWYKKEDLEKIK